MHSKRLRHQVSAPILSLSRLGVTMPDNAPEQQGQAISVQQAVSAAILYFQTLYQQPVSDVAVEEVQKVDNDKYWLITLGYSAQKPPFVVTGVRSYKDIRVNAATG